ncbi:hypothetical protein KFK09_011991 [Dendrobium nobile]|uniref:Uncharacterized protein n=1 Tax=Dendrobium nobile TaxID=94219 RepID=A0A8T3BHI0_DENNO|nr:hypothetical protein KFK09_011991 [Dendrobium nobile]
MPTVASCLPRALLRPIPPLPPPAALFCPRLTLSPSRFASLRNSRLPILVAASAASFDGHELDAKGWSKPRSSKKSLLSDLIQEIEPLDLNLIQKDVPAVTVDAMKRTISGMLGILPSDRFNVVVEALWERLFKLLVSSMMTGYTLRNAEYRLFLERKLEIFGEFQDKDGHLEGNDIGNVVGNDCDKLLDRTPTLFELAERDISSSDKIDEVPLCEDIDFEGLGEMTPQAKEYIRSLKFRISSVEKVLELSEPTHSEVLEIIHSVAHGLLATLSPKIHSKPSPHSDNVPGSASSIGKDDCAELLENTSIHFQPLITVPRDYLARLLFWCLLLGHYLRGLEHRLELTQLLTIAGDP